MKIAESLQYSVDVVVILQRIRIDQSLGHEKRD